MQITKPENLSNENIIFHEAKDYKVKESKFKYNRIKIETKYLNKKTGPLIIENHIHLLLVSTKNRVSRNR